MQHRTKFLLLNIGLAVLLQFGMADIALAAKSKKEETHRPKLIKDQKGAKYGSSKDDVLRGGNGEDFINGLSGDDELFGGAGDDTMNGSNGDDYLEGGDGTDRLSGSSGDDVFYGGLGPDKLHGGKGNDIYVYKSVKDAPYTGERSVKYDWEIIKPNEPHTVGFDGAGKAKGDVIDLRGVGKLEFGKHVTVRNKGWHSQVLVDVNLDKKPDMEIVIYDTSSVDAEQYTKDDFLLGNK